MSEMIKSRRLVLAFCASVDFLNLRAAFFDILNIFIVPPVENESAKSYLRTVTSRPRSIVETIVTECAIWAVCDSENWNMRAGAKPRGAEGAAALVSRLKPASAYTWTRPNLNRRT